MATITNEAVLDLFRTSGPCEYCGRWCERRDPHHARAKGLGGGSRLDLPINLISLCRKHHDEAHAGNIPRHVILALIAVRERKWPEEIEAEIHLLLRTPKGDMP